MFAALVGLGVLLIVGTLMPWRVVDGNDAAAVNGLYNSLFGPSGENRPYLGPGVLGAAFLTILTSGVVLVRAGLRHKACQIAAPLAASTAVVAGPWAWILASRNRTMVNDPSFGDLTWSGRGVTQHAGSGLGLVQVASVTMIVIGAVLVSIQLARLVRPTRARTAGIG